MRIANQVNLIESKRGLCVHQWHRVLGHRSIEAVHDIPRSNFVDGMLLADCDSDCKYLKDCEICIKAKITRTPFPKSSKSKSFKILDLVHSDICGPMQTPTAAGKRYILTFIDDFSRFTTIYLLKEKSEAFKCFKEFRELTRNRFNTTIKRLWTDRGGEYMCTQFVDYLKANGIGIERTAPYSPAQNGIAERKNRTLIEMARCMLIDAGLEYRFWGEAVTTANFLQNRLPWKNAPSTPFQLWHGCKPIYTNLKRFGASCFIKIPDQHRRKLDCKADKGIVMGFDLESKAFRVYVPSSNKIVISRDIKFVNDLHTGHVSSSSGTSFKPTNGLNNNKSNVQETYIHINSEDVDLAKDKNDDSRIITEDQEVNNDQDDRNRHNIKDEDTYDPAEEPDNQLQDSQTPKRPIRCTKGVPPRRLVEEINTVIGNEPSSYNEAISGAERDNWTMAMVEQYESLIKNRTWKLVNLPPNKNVIGCKWVFKLKTEADGKTPRYKARLVAQGFNQKFGVDYDLVFAPVARHSTFRVLLSIAASRQMSVYHLDAKTAFLNGDLHEEIYMSQPPGFVSTNAERKVCLLNKSIYGLRKSARIWYEKLHNILTGAGYNQSRADSCLYVSQTPSGNTYILIYVDDILVVSNLKTHVLDVEKVLKSNFEIKNLGLIANYLGMRITKGKDFYLLDQEDYIIRMTKRFGLENTKIADIPLSPSYHREPDGNRLLHNEEYRAAIGSLLYVSVNTRPDISAAVTILSQKVENPTQSDWIHVKKLIKYLRGSSNFRLKFFFFFFYL